MTSKPSEESLESALKDYQTLRKEQQELKMLQQERQKALVEYEQQKMLAHHSQTNMQDLMDYLSGGSEQQDPFPEKKNYLYDRSKIKELEEIVGFDVKFNKHSRQSGRSTAIAFHTIANAMMNPGLPTAIVDHHESAKANKLLMNTIVTMVRDLRLKGFTFDKKKLTVEYNIFEPPSKAEQVIYY